VRLRWRAETVGPVEPSHFIFASFKPVGKFENKELVGIHMIGFDPTRPVGSWKKAWRKLTTKAGLKGLRFHDLRHHAITELAESGASEQTILSIAGHVSRRMLERYSHIRMEAKRNALGAISQSGIGNGTVNGTKKGNEAPDVPILGRKMVGAWGFEPQTPTVSGDVTPKCCSKRLTSNVTSAMCRLICQPASGSRV
jgi:integrase-like protein